MSDLTRSTSSLSSLIDPPAKPKPLTAIVHSLSHTLLITDIVTLSVDLSAKMHKLSEATEEEISKILLDHFEKIKDNTRVVLDLGDVHVSDYKITIHPAAYHSKWRRSEPDSDSENSTDE